jgi:hypothetical protein
MKRLEYKYLVPVEDLAALRGALAPFVEADGHARQPGGYTVRSIYFDTPALDCYHQKEAGLQRRQKLRLRGYGAQQPQSLAFLEIKRKDDMAISKSRCPVPYRQIRALFASGDVGAHVPETPGFPRAAAEARGFFFHLYRRALRPTVLVVYEREAFYQHFDPSVRLTFDKELRSRLYPAVEELFAEEDLEPSLAGHFILEIKFSERFPSFLRALLEEFRLERRALSKYTICLETHHLPWQGSRQRVLSLSRPLPLAEG